MTTLESLHHDHVALRVVDYDAAIDWYTTKLDFAVDQQWPYGDMIELSAPADDG